MSESFNHYFYPPHWKFPLTESIGLYWTLLIRIRTLNTRGVSNRSNGICTRYYCVLLYSQMSYIHIIPLDDDSKYLLFFGHFPSCFVIAKGHGQGEFYIILLLRNFSLPIRIHNVYMSYIGAYRILYITTEIICT